MLSLRVQVIVVKKYYISNMLYIGVSNRVNNNDDDDDNDNDGRFWHGQIEMKVREPIQNKRVCL